MYTALHLSATEYHDFSTTGFETEDLAWKYIKSMRCSLCKEDEEEIFACDFNFAETEESDIKCTGNNDNGCFMDSCGHDCGCESIKK